MEFDTTTMRSPVGLRSASMHPNTAIFPAEQYDRIKPLSSCNQLGFLQREKARHRRVGEGLKKTGGTCLTEHPSPGAELLESAQLAHRQTGQEGRIGRSPAFTYSSLKLTTCYW